MLLTHDFFLNPTMDGPLFPALFSLNMHINNHEGRSFSAEEIIEMMNSTGIGSVVHLPFRGGNDSSILQGMIVGVVKSLVTDGAKVSTCCISVHGK